MKCCKRACTNSGISFPLYVKFFGEPCRNVIVRFPNVSFLEEPEVRKQAFIGTCVEKPNLLAAVSPVGIIFALSRFAISFTNSKAEGYTTPNRVLRAFMYTPLAMRVINPPFQIGRGV